MLYSLALSDMVGTFVSIGNSPRQFSRLLDEVARIAPFLPQPIIVQNGRTPFDHPAIEHFDFVDEQAFQTHLKECQIFITHGGGGSVLTAIKLGKIPVVVPRLVRHGEVVDDHQVAFAAELERQGKIVAVDDVAGLKDAVAAALARPARTEAETENKPALDAIAAAIAEFAPLPEDSIALVSPSGGHLTEIRELSQIYRDHPHFFVVNVPLAEPQDMKGRTIVITLSERDWKFLINVREAFAILRARRPRVILTTGGGFSVAFSLVGKFLGIPTIYIETVAKVTVPTVTGRFMYRLADRFFYQWPNLARYFPRGEYIGLVL